MLEVQHISKSFGALKALDDVSFRVAPGELFGFVGSNGAGKTTTMRIMLGVLAADAGTTLWNGQALASDLRRRVGYMPAERGLYPKMPVGKQLAYLARLHGLSAQAAERAVTEWTERLGVAHRRDDAVQTLSLGNQQRVQLAAALVHDPEVLVLDEPFSGLDPVAVDVMSGVLREKAAAGVPVIFSSHQLDLVERLCDRVGIISQGVMVANGTIGELRSGAGRVYALAVATPSLPAALSAAGFTAAPDPLAGSPDAPLEDGYSRAVVTLKDSDDEQRLLRAALDLGTVLEFGPRRPHLVDRFKDVVTATVEDPVEPKRKRSLFSRKGQF